MDTDHNLLFGVLALQADLLDPARFVEACVAWTARKDRPLADLLVDRGWITPADGQVIEHLLELKLKRHGGDVHASLAAVLDDRARGCLSALVDADVHATLSRLSQPEGHVLVSTTDYTPGARERYTLTRLHAKGGIGQVWVARDEAMGREVALKELRPEQAASPALWARFLEEARITGQLEHPGVVPVYELATPPGDRQPFYTMRFVKGRTLAEAARDYHRRRAAGEARPVEFQALLQALLGICNAVAYAHARGVLHRDLKPQNVVLGDFGEVIVLDWGLAKLVDQPEETLTPAVAVDHPEGRGETAAGQVMGTPAYMAPEQAEGRWDAVDRRCDVYGLGAILYEVLTGRLPFDGADTAEVLRKVVQEPPERPRKHNPEVPRALEAVCLKAMAKQPQGRYDSAGEVADEVRHYLADEPVRAYREPAAARAGRWMRRHRTLMTAASAAMLVALMGLATTLAVQASANQKLRDANRRVTRANAELQDANAQVQARYELAMDAIGTFHTGVSEDFLLKEPKFQGLRDRLLNAASTFYSKLGALLGRRSDLASRKAVGQANFAVAELTAMVGRKEDALAAHRRVLVDQEALSGEPGADDRFRADVGSSLLAIGRLLAETGRTDEALADYDRARSVFQQLADDHPAMASYRDALARAHHYTGDMHWFAGHYAEAIESHGRSAEIWGSLAKAYPGVVRYGNGQGRSELYRGANLGMVGRTDEALASFERARMTLQELLDDNPAVVELQVDLATCLSNIGVLLYQADRTDEALAALRQGLELRRRLADANPAVTDFQHRVARSHGNIGVMLLEAGRVDDAAEAQGRSVAILQKLVDDNPSVTSFRRSLANSLNESGDVLRLVGRVAEARAAYERALPIFEGLIKVDSVAAQDKGLMIQCLKGLGATRLAEGRTAAAVAAWRRAVAIGERLRSEYGETLYYVACCHALLGVAAGQVGSGLSAEEGPTELDRAMDILHRAIRAGFRNTIRMRNDPDLEPLRSHPGFRSMMMDLAFPVNPFARGD